jgi:hypothetical protein
MFIFIPTTTYNATVKGSIVKSVTCENCGHAYSYRMSRVVNGSEQTLFSSSRGHEKALKKAQVNLTKALDTEHDDVPCPACNWHQAPHIACVRVQSYPQLKSLAGAFFFLAGLALGVIVFFTVLFALVGRDHPVPKPTTVLILAIVVLAIASPGLLLRGLRSLLLLTYRPNG